MVQKLIPIPVPLKGLNTVEPDLPIDAMYARELTNFIIVNGRLRQRPSVRTRYTLGNTDEPCWWDSAGSRAILKNLTGDIINISTLAVTGNVGGPTVNVISPIVIKHLSLELLIGIREPRSPYPAGFTAWAFTTIGIAADTIIAACSHKGRLYVAAGSVIEYSNVAAITGTMAGSFNVAEFTNNEPVEYLYSFNTQPGQANDENIFVIITANKILIYAGDFPASQTWNLIASFSIGTTSNLVKEVEGDLYLATPTLFFELSTLLQQGITSITSQPLNNAIRNIWAEQIWDFGVSIGSIAEVAHIWFHKELDIVVCSCFQTTLQPYFEYSNEQISFVYHRKYGAWTVWAGMPIFAPVIKHSNVYTAANYRKLIGQLAIDDFDFGLTGGTKIEMSWKTPLANPFRGQLQQVLGVRPRWRYKRRVVMTNPDSPPATITTNNTTAPLEIVRSVFDNTDYVVSSNGSPIKNVWPFYQQETANVAVVNPENYAELSIEQPANISGNYAPFAGLNGIGEGVGLHIVKKNDVDDPNDANYLQTSTTEFEIYGATIYAKDGGVIF
jgi:hypothetical protein